MFLKSLDEWFRFLLSLIRPVSNLPDHFNLVLKTLMNLVLFWYSSDILIIFARPYNFFIHTERASHHVVK